MAAVPVSPKFQFHFVNVPELPVEISENVMLRVSQVGLEKLKFAEGNACTVTGWVMVSELQPMADLIYNVTVYVLGAAHFFLGCCALEVVPSPKSQNHWVTVLAAAVL